MEKESLELLNIMGFSAAYTARVETHLQAGLDNCCLAEKKVFAGGTLRCLAHLAAGKNTPAITIEKLEVMLQYPLPAVYEGEGREEWNVLLAGLQQIDWNAFEFTRGYQLQYGGLPTALQEELQQVFSQLAAFGGRGEAEQQLCDKLKLNFFYDTCFSRDYHRVAALDRLAASYYPFKSYYPPGPFPTLEEIYNILVRLTTTSGTSPSRQKKKQGPAKN